MKKKNIYLVIAVLVLVIIVSFFFAARKGLFKPSKTLAPNETQGPTQQTFGDQYDFRIANPQCLVKDDTTTLSFEIKNVGTALMGKGDTVNLNLSSDGRQVKKEVITERVVPDETSSTYQLTLKGFPKTGYNLTIASRWDMIRHKKIVRCEKE